jgi:DNA-directed RNA polymerase specialized sigma24 family protein
MAERLHDAATTDAGIQACFEELGTVERQQARAVVMSNYYLSYEDADDVAMEALIAVCTSQRLAAYRNLAAVYQTAAKRRAMTRRGRGAREVFYDDGRAPCGSFQPDDTRLEVELLVASGAFDALDETKRDAIVLWAQGYSHAEIASKLHITARESNDGVRNGLDTVKRELKRRCSYNVH